MDFAGEEVSKVQNGRGRLTEWVNKGEGGGRVGEVVSVESEEQDGYKDKGSEDQEYFTVRSTNPVEVSRFD